ncbi:hypothetical protein GCM10007907_16820 [Chitinimonas prasina]|uniref:Uncharacterized protein n=1 Tax=Chitinimonas prasina TaxID=1434937 RepID=A0ABQ5YEK2_9NEIS|nr:hypothetical protein GCM10007907_16820 [Chitinimonas prasina]
MTFKQCWVVQSIRRGLFLKPGREPGDVDTTELIAQAGWFDSERAALDTAVDHLDPHDFLLFSFWVPSNDIRLERMYE